MSTNESIQQNRLRALLKEKKYINNKKISDDNLIRYAEALCNRLKKYLQENLKKEGKSEYYKKNIKSNFDESYQSFFINITSNFPKPTNRSVLNTFAKGNGTSDYLDLIALCFGYAGFNGFKENKSIADIFDIDIKKEGYRFTKALEVDYKTEKGKNRSIIFEQIDIVPNSRTISILSKFDEQQKQKKEDENNKPNNKKAPSEKIQQPIETKGENSSNYKKKQEDTQKNETNNLTKKRKEKIAKYLILLLVIVVTTGYIYYSNNKSNKQTITDIEVPIDSIVLKSKKKLTSKKTDSLKKEVNPKTKRLDNTQIITKIYPSKNILKNDKKKKPFFSEGFAWVKKNNKYGLIDTSNNLIIEYQFEKANPFKKGLARVSMNGKSFYFIDHKGNIKVHPLEKVSIKNNSIHQNNQTDRKENGFTSYGKPSNYFMLENKDLIKNNLGIIEKGEKVGLINLKTKKTIIPPIYYMIKFVSDKLIWAKLSNAGNWSNQDIYTVNGKKLFSRCQFQRNYHNQSFRSGDSTTLKPINKDGKYGYINKHGKLIIPFEYHDAEPFEKKLAIVSKKKFLSGTKYGMINKKGNTVIPLIYDYIMISNSMIYVNKKKNWFYIDENNKCIKNCK